MAGNPFAHPTVHRFQQRRTANSFQERDQHHGRNETGSQKSSAGPPPDEYEQNGLDGEPLSLAEELAAEAARGDDTHDRYEQIKQGDIHIAELHNH